MSDRASGKTVYSAEIGGGTDNPIDDPVIKLPRLRAGDPARGGRVWFDQSSNDD